MNLDLSSFLADQDTLVRLAIAVLGGILLGLDREVRGKAAGIRTHALVGLSSAVITISALMVYEGANAAGQGTDIDPLRVIQGLAQAIGFIAAGMIIVARGDVRNLTSAANLWLTTAVGIAAGAAQFALAAAAVLFGLVILVVVRFIEPLIPGSDKDRTE